ncbi:MAG: MBL fold metallo-hydrolase, partial [Rhizobiaceae bacterium]
IERFLKEREVQAVLLAHDEVKTAAETQELVDDCRSRVKKVEESIIAHIKAEPGISFIDLRDKCCDDQDMVREWRALVSIDASLKDFSSKGLVEQRDGGWHYVG